MSASIPFPRTKSNSSYIPRKGSKRSLTVLFDPAWKEMTDHQELLLMILDIREELIANVYKEYAEKYLEKQSAKFIVNCALDAWKKIVNLNFLSNNFQNLSNKTYWVPDSEPVICKPDSWSRANLKINMKNYPKEMFQQTDEDADYIFESVSYPTSDAYELPLKKTTSVFELEDVVCNSLASISSERRYSKVTLPQSTVQFSNMNFKGSERMSLSNVLSRANTTSDTNIFYKVMKMPKQSLSALISTFRTPQKLKMHPWHLDDEIHDDFRKPYTITPLRLNAAIILKPPSCVNTGVRASARESRIFLNGQSSSRSNITHKSNRIKGSKSIRSSSLQTSLALNEQNE